MVKFGYRTPSLKKSFSARTTGKLTRSVKKLSTPGYGSKGIGLISNPKKALYNQIYNKTTTSILNTSPPKRSKATFVPTSHNIDYPNSIIPYSNPEPELDLVIKSTEEQIRLYTKEIDAIYENRRFIIFLIAILLFILYLVSLANDIILLLLAGLIFSFMLIILITIFPSQNRVETLKNDIKLLSEISKKQHIEKKKEEEIKSRTLYDIALAVKGISYKQKEFDELCKQLIKKYNPLPYMGYDRSEIKEEVEYGGKFYKYPTFYSDDVEFVPEPDNEFDTNALKIIVCGYHLGYVSKSKAKKVLRFISDSNNIVIKFARIYGGEFREININTNRLHTVQGTFKIKIDLKVMKK